MSILTILYFASKYMSIISIFGTVGVIVAIIKIQELQNVVGIFSEHVKVSFNSFSEQPI
jgi:hypothetical protein